MEKDRPIQPEENLERHLTEEELFLEEVLQAQEEALMKEREERLNGGPPKKRKPFATRLIIWLMSLGLVFSTFAIIFEIYSIPAIEFIKTSAKLSQDPNIKQYKKAVVEISTGESKGTGFIVTEDGYIITNEHVIEGFTSVTVTIPSQGVVEGTVVEQYADVDLAVVKIDAANKTLSPLQLAASYEFQNDERVQFIGNPLYFTNIANEGHVVGMGTYELNAQIIQLKAPVYKGNSGSPVINKDGQVVGVIYATTKTNSNGKVGLFIPIQKLHERFKFD